MEFYNLRMDTKRMVQVQSRLPKSLFHKVEKEARKRGITRSRVIRDAVETYMEDK